MTGKQNHPFSLQHPFHASLPS